MGGIKRPTSIPSLSFICCLPRIKIRYSLTSQVMPLWVILCYSFISSLMVVQLDVIPMMYSFYMGWLSSSITIYSICSLEDPSSNEAFEINLSMREDDPVDSFFVSVPSSCLIFWYLNLVSMSLGSVLAIQSLDIWTKLNKVRHFTIIDIIEFGWIDQYPLVWSWKRSCCFLINISCSFFNLWYLTFS